jgi:hypothetical protein
MIHLPLFPGKISSKVIIKSDVHIYLRREDNEDFVIGIFCLLANLISIFASVYSIVSRTPSGRKGGKKSKANRGEKWQKKLSAHHL